jgi:hypothetical protein
MYCTVQYCIYLNTPDSNWEFLFYLQELRTKNWKAMDALSNMEKMYANLLKSVPWINAYFGLLHTTSTVISFIPQINQLRATQAVVFWGHIENIKINKLYCKKNTERFFLCPIFDMFIFSSLLFPTDITHWNLSAQCIWKTKSLIFSITFLCCQKFFLHFLKVWIERFYASILFTFFVLLSFVKPMALNNFAFIQLIYKFASKSLFYICITYAYTFVSV